ncbi:aryl-sulfate sulfotransferase [Christensenellaceae bacterium OttesenSCG-928-K19]|nr:aryl-sulfate sulfotransferase [Christensenellaceae bacterium OttesenSCG-928-K19]
MQIRKSWKMHIVLCCLLLAMLLAITACSAPQAEEASSPAQTATPAPEPSAEATTPAASSAPTQGTEDAEAEMLTDFTARQAAHAQADKEIAGEFAAEEYTPESPLVIPDPYGESPLTAMVLFQTPEPTSAEITVKGKDDATSISHEFNKSVTEHRLPVYGLYADTLNEVAIILKSEDGTTTEHTVSIQTAALPGDISKAEVRTAQPEKMADGLTFFDCPHLNGNYALAVDANGDIRWYLTDKNLNFGMNMSFMENGNFIVGSGNVQPGGYNNLQSVIELSPLGKFVREYEIYSLHHDVREKSNGNLIMAASMEGRESQNDYIVEVDRQTGEILDSWDLMEILPMSVFDTQPPYSGGLNNWLHNNGLWYIEEEDALLISGRHQNLVAKIDAKTKELIWAFSQTVGELNEEMRPYLLEPADGEFEYPTSQHAPMLLPDGRLMLFDNRNQMETPEDGAELDQELLYSRAVIYSIDEENQTIAQDWQFGKERQDLYSSFASDVDYLGENHYMIDFGGMYVKEDGTHYDHLFTPPEIKFASSRTSVVVELLNDEIVFEVLLYGNENSNSSKAERHVIYQNAQEITLG